MNSLDEIIRINEQAYQQARDLARGRASRDTRRREKRALDYLNKLRRARN